MARALLNLVWLLAIVGGWTAGDKAFAQSGCTLHPSGSGVLCPRLCESGVTNCTVCPVHGCDLGNFGWYMPDYGSSSGSSPGGPSAGPGQGANSSSGSRPPPPTCKHGKPNWHPDDASTPNEGSWSCPPPPRRDCPNLEASFDAERDKCVKDAENQAIACAIGKNILEMVRCAALLINDKQQCEATRTRHREAAKADGCNMNGA